MIAGWKRVPITAMLALVALAQLAISPANFCTLGSVLPVFRCSQCVMSTNQAALQAEGAHSAPCCRSRLRGNAPHANLSITQWEHSARERQAANSGPPVSGEKGTVCTCGQSEPRLESVSRASAPEPVFIRFRWAGLETLLARVNAAPIATRQSLSVDFAPDRCARLCVWII